MPAAIRPINNADSATARIVSSNVKPGLAAVLQPGPLACADENVSWGDVVL
jgi:hypothetical protein